MTAKVQTAANMLIFHFLPFFDSVSPFCSHCVIGNAKNETLGITEISDSVESRSDLQIDEMEQISRRRLQDIFPDASSSMTAQIVFYCILSLFVVCILTVIWWMVQKWRSYRLSAHTATGLEFGYGVNGVTANTTYPVTVHRYPVDREHNEHGVEPSVLSKSSMLTQIRSFNAAHALSVSPPLDQPNCPNTASRLTAVPFSFSETSMSRPLPIPRQGSQSESTSLQCSVSRNGHAVFKVIHFGGCW